MNMKKIVIISPRLENAFSGAENYIVSLAKHLTKKYEVHIITKQSDTEYPNLENIKMHYIEGFGSGNVNILKAIPKLKEVLDEINPEVVHIHCFISLFLYSSIIEGGKYKVVVTVHSTPDGNGKLFSWFDGIKNQKSFIEIMYDKIKPDVTIFGSKYYQDEYTKYVPLMKKISKCVVNPYFSDINKFSLEKRKDVDANSDRVIRLLFPSRIVKRKGIEETLQLLKMLPKNYVLDLPAMPQMEYMEYNKVILDKIKELKLEDRVFYPDKKVVGKEMDKYYKQSTISLIPSYFEGFGIVAVEALNTSNVVVTTATGGLSEIIKDKYNGIKISLDNLNMAKNKIIEVVNNQDYRYLLIKNGHKTIEEKYKKERHMNVIDNIYKELIGD